MAKGNRNQEEIKDTMQNERRRSSMLRTVDGSAGVHTAPYSSSSD